MILFYYPLAPHFAMAKFIIYNIQLLPNDDETPEVGVSGYKKLFSKLRELNSEHLKAKTQAEFHHPITADIYIGPIDFRFPSGYVCGHFVRYRKTDQVTELATGKNLYSSKGRTVGVTSQHKIPFVFDADRHLFAIAGGNLLPKPQPFIAILAKFFSSVAADNFPKHTLNINLISRANALEAVFNTAVAYKTVHVNLTAPNGHGAEDILREMRESKTQNVALHASGGKDGRMKDIPEFIKKILRAATGYGWSKLTYFINNGKPGEDKTRKEIYDSREAPRTFALKHSKNDTSEEDFLKRVAEKLGAIDISESVEEDEIEDAEDTED